jgi:alpha-tubulin suppressor-like RCC1 family protein
MPAAVRRVPATLTLETSPLQTPQEVMGMNEPVEAVATGHYHTLCLTKAGNVWAFGSNSNGQLGVKSAGAAPDPLAFMSRRFVHGTNRDLARPLAHSIGGSLRGGGGIASGV